MKVGCYLAYQQLDYQLIGVSPITFKQVKFTGMRQVPVLKIGDEWKLDSEEIGFWLEDKFPGSQLFGASQADRTQIVELDKWVSHRLIPVMFRSVVDWPGFSAGFTNGWKLAGAVNRATPIPRWVQLMWPLFLRRAKFILALVDTLDRSESLQQTQKKTINNFVELLDEGPFLGGRDHPSIADLSAFPIIVFPYRFGLKGGGNWLDDPTVMEWISAVQKFLPDNPFLVDSGQLRHALPGISSV